MSGPTVAPAKFSTLANGDIRIVRREYLEAITAPSTTFNVKHSHLNPGKAIFHWLSQVADNYEEYVFERLSFEYKPVVSSATYSGSMGSIVVAVLYNAGSANLDSYYKMVEYSGAIEKRICDPLVMKVNVSKSTHAGEDHYIRTGDVPMGEDIKTYDIGKLLVATDHVSSSFPEGTLLGHMYADYSVILKKPKLKVDTVTPAADAAFGNWRTLVCTPRWLESGLQALSANNMLMDFVTNPDNDRQLYITFPTPGRYHVTMSTTLDGIASLAVVFTGMFWIPLSTTSGDQNADTLSDTITPYESILTGFVEVTSNEAQMSFVPSTTGVNMTGFNFLVVGVPNDGSLSWSAV